MTQIASIIYTSIYRIELIFEKTKLEKGKCLKDYQIQNKSKLTLNVLSEESGRKYEKLFTTKTTIKISNSEQSMINYSEIRMITVF
jgi:hypothetical protein